MPGRGRAVKQKKQSVQALRGCEGALPMKAPILGLLVAASLSSPWEVGQAVRGHADGRLRVAQSAGIVEAYLPVIQPSSHAANLIVLKNGDLLCFWFTGTWEGQSGVGIAVSRLARGS